MVTEPVLCRGKFSFRTEGRDAARATLQRAHATGSIGIAVLTSRNMLPVELHVLAGAKLPVSLDLDGREVDPDFAGHLDGSQDAPAFLFVEDLTLPVTMRVRLPSPAAFCAFCITTHRCSRFCAAFLARAKEAAVSVPFAWEIGWLKRWCRFRAPPPSGRRSCAARDFPAADAVERTQVVRTDPPRFSIVKSGASRVRMRWARRARLAPADNGLGERLLQQVGN